MAMARPAAARLLLDFSLHAQCAGGAPGPALAPPPVLRLDTPWNAAAIERCFKQQRAAWYPAPLRPHVERIAALLAQERRLSERWRGLPGTDHPSFWDTQADASRAQRPRLSRRVALWQPPVAWLLPVVAETPCELVVRLPAAGSARAREARQALQAMSRAALPAAWRRRQVAVQLELESRVYWGARGIDGHWQPCRGRGDGLSRRVPLFELRRGRARRGRLPGLEDDAPSRLPSEGRHGRSSRFLSTFHGQGVGADDLDLPTHWQRHLPAGVGLLVATPVLVFERRRCWCDRVQAAWRHMVRRLGGGEDRDPTFAARLQHDEPRWNAATGARPLPAPAWRRALQDGAVLRPASAPAVAWQRGHAPIQPPSSHLVLLHGGMSCVRAAFEALLVPAAAWPTRPGPLWQQLPLLDRVCTWRFEHDSFVAVAHNIVRLERWLAGEVVRGRPAGRLVLLAHSRGGNVARFALAPLRRAFPGWRIAAVTCGSPLLGTQVFSRVGRRWAGLATLLGVFREAAQGWLTREQLAQLVNLERGLSYELPPGIHDVEPQGVARMAGGRPQELPSGLWTWGSDWGAGARSSALELGLWDWLVEDLGGAEVGGDGLVARHSALGGRAPSSPGAHDASPVFHTQYFAHPATRAAIADRLARLLED